MKQEKEELEAIQNEDADNNDENLSEVSEDNLENSANDSYSNKEDELPKFAKERLGRQKKRYEREIKEKENIINQLRAKQQDTDSLGDYNNEQNNFQSEIQAPPDPYDIPGQIQYAFAKHEEEKKQREQQLKQQSEMQNQMALLQQEYSRFEKDLNDASEKYPDFDEVVRNNPDIQGKFNTHIVDAAVGLPNGADVFYHLAKKPELLDKVSKIKNPFKVQRELNNLSRNIERQSSPNNSEETEIEEEIMPTMRGRQTNSVKNMSNASVNDLRKLFRKSK